MSKDNIESFPVGARGGLGRLLGNLSGSDDRSAALPEEDSAEAPTAPPLGQMYRRATPASGGNLTEIRIDLDGARRQLDDVHGMVARLLERKPVEQNVFDALHVELKDYKNDFFYERLKPIVRPMLDTLDSMTEFFVLLEAREAAGEARDPETLRLTRENLSHFAAQLADVLAVCEAFPLEVAVPGAAFDPARHRTVETAHVAPEQVGAVLSVKRPGWTLGRQVLRPAEVVRGIA